MHQVQVFDSTERLVSTAVELIRSRARAALRERGRFVIALSGGSTPRPVYEEFAATELDWSRVFVFLADERFVPPDNAWSNLRLVRESLVDRVPQLPRQNVFSVPLDAPAPKEGARLYSNTLRQFFQLGTGELPRFDLTVNGMGPDGHTASLFPHSSAGAPGAIARMAHAGQPPWVDRITLTLPVFNHARCVLFLVTGANKAPVVKQVLEGKPNWKHWPASGVHPEEGELLWLMDAPAAALLENPDVR